MQRIAMQRLKEWKVSTHRKPLIIRGVRQVGKTWLMTQFAREHFADRFHYFNFDMDPALRELFRASRSPKVILEALAYRSERSIETGDLIIFDEAQAAPEAIHALKYFCEFRSDLFVLLAGSLLGLQLARPESYPVGKVDFLTLEPMTFTEFLLAQGETGLVDCLRNWSELEPLPNLLFEPLSTKLRHYQTVGGMPEAVSAWCERQDLKTAREIQHSIMEAYRQDVFSHADAVEVPKIQRIWQSLPRQLSRENNRFRYSEVEPRSNARKYGDALQWLIDARMVRCVHRITIPGIPLSAYEDPGSFKIYFVDIGLFARVCGIDPVVLQEEPALYREMKGAMAENLVLQSLSTQFEEPLFYWSNPKPQAEVDFVASLEGVVIPIEVKASTNVKSPSLKTFMEKYGAHIPLRVRFSMRNLSLDDGLLNIPLFMADEAQRLIRLAIAT